MGFFVLPLAWAVCSTPTSPALEEQTTFLYQPAYCVDEVLRLPAEPFNPQPGDIFLATDQATWSRVGHWLAGGAGIHHSGIIFARSTGQLGLLEAGPFNSICIEVVDPLAHMRRHVQSGDCVWIRRRSVPLTPDQSARLTAFAEAQVGKPFAVLRLVGQVTPFRSRGPLRTWLVGRPHGERRNYFCSELVMECCVAAGLVDRETTRPAATYPRDLFLGKSFNLYSNRHLHLEPDWLPPAGWTECRHADKDVRRP
jgi:hypothetical protein